MGARRGLSRAGLPAFCLGRLIVELQSARTRAVVALLCFGLATCGGGDDSDDSGGSGNPTGPAPGSGPTCSSISVLGNAMGNINATIPGPFNGGVTTGGSNYVVAPAIPSLGLPAQDSFTSGAVCGDGSQIIITTRAGTNDPSTGIFTVGRTGTKQIGHINGVPASDPQTKQPLPDSIMLLLVANGVSAGGWQTNINGGSGSITLNSVSRSGAAGSFSVTMIPIGPPASGNRQVSGTFNVTFQP
jgi:hypothetical protein